MDVDARRAFATLLRRWWLYFIRFGGPLHSSGVERAPGGRASLTPLGRFACDEAPPPSAWSYHRLGFLTASLVVFALIGAPLSICAAPLSFDIPAQRGSDALLAFASQAHVEVLFPFEELRGVQSNEVIGEVELESALNRLLANTGYHARHVGPNKFVVLRLAAPTGAITGRLLGPNGLPAASMRVVTSDGRHFAESNDEGEFSLERLPPATYQVNIYGGSFRPLELIDLRVEAERVLNVETQHLQSADEPIRLAPQIVEGRFFRRWKNRGKVDFHPQEAAGNLDLPRTENDALPYTIYDRDQIARSGVVNLNDFLQRNVLDSAAGTRPPDQQPGSDGGAAGTVLVASSSNLQLRGYTAEETAILVNGRRLPEVFTSGNQAPAQPPDVNFIPLSMVERVEVLPISSSALYTGNPVGGVINIVLRPDVNVTELNTTYTNSLGKFDAPQSTISLQHGETLLGGKLRVRLNVSFTEATPANESELGYIQGNIRVTPVIPSPDLHRATPNIFSSNGSPLFGPGSPSFTSVAPGANGATAAAAFAGRAGVLSTALFDTPGGLANSSDSIDYAYGRRQRGTNYFGSAVYDVRPWLQIGIDGIFNRSVINRGYSVFPGNLTLPATPKGPLVNPFGQQVDVSLNETVPALGQNFGEGQIDFYAAVVGLLVRLPSDWRISLDSQYGHSLTRYRGIAGIDNEKWQKLVDDGIYNPLRDTQVYGPPPEFYDQALIYYGAKGRFVTIGDYQTLDTAVRVTNQSVPLPTGSGAINFGGDYRVNRLGGYTDERRYGNGDYADDPVRWKGRIIERVSLFGELQAPLLPSKWLPRWIHEIETDLAARYVAAATAQETNVAPTAALKIDFAGGLALRGSVATANRFPPPYMSSKGAVAAGPGGGDVSFVTINDPRRNEEYGVQSSIAINPNLRVEANVTRAAGLVYEQGKVHRVRLAVDFSDTRKSGEQVTLNETSVLKLESSFPDRVKRLPLDPNDTGHSVGRVESLLIGPVNLAWRESQNWTTGLDYAWTECFSGRLDVYGRWSYFSRYAVKVLPNDPTVDELDHPDGAVMVLKHRVNFGASWSKKDFGVGFDGHYYHSRPLPLSDWPSQHRRQINPYWEFDTFVQSDLTRWLPWKFTRFGLHGQLRVNNILDTRPPRYASDPSGAGVQTYGDWRRRTYAVSVNVSF